MKIGTFSFGRVAQVSASVALAGALMRVSAASPPAETLRIPLSGTGPSDAVDWDFQITEGRRAGERATIPVPSNWEQHGFGNYDYGMVPMDKKHKEDGIYGREFRVPAEWAGRRIWVLFEGVMTDASVTVNGHSAGPMHQGGFYPFEYDITDKVRVGELNRLEVHVSKDSANPTIEQAERSADYWVFGGIYRPVWLEARPAQAIAWSAVDAKADGNLTAEVHLGGDGDANQVRLTVMDAAGRILGKPLTAPVNGISPVRLVGRFGGVENWSAEEPVLYHLELQLLRDEVLVHRTRQRIGFRTFESRRGEGIFLNGKRIMIKGVNRHCFRPESARALDAADSLEDVKLIKAANMNAVRCSHYPPDKAFLEACDELGLYVEEEICTWQKPALDTPSARRFIGQMMRRDVNHPSILWWANGNEGGWNTEVDGDFHQWDLQKRPVLHPWELFSGYQTRHYPTWERFQHDLAGPDLVMPTEYLHGLFDGGHGAGLEDFWTAMRKHRNAVGGFLWVFADEGVCRTDRGGEIDNWGTNAPDGLVGPHHEKEASFLTLQDVFSPVQIPLQSLPAGFDGRLPVENQYDFRDLSSCRFRWQLLRGNFEPAESGELPGPMVAAGAAGEIRLPLPEGWNKAKALQVEAFDREGGQLWKWCWPVSEDRIGNPEVLDKVTRTIEGDSVVVRAAGCSYRFSMSTGLLVSASCGDAGIGLANGPRWVGGEPGPPAVEQGEEGEKQWSMGVTAGESFRFRWTVTGDGALSLDYHYHIDDPVVAHGITFDLDESQIRRFAWTGQGPERVWANRMRGGRFGTFLRQFQKVRAGRDYDHPHVAGFYAGVRSAEVTTGAGRLMVEDLPERAFLRVGTEDEGEKIKVTWPSGNLSVLHAIPAIGNKFHPPEAVSPQGFPHPAPGSVEGRIRFRILPPAS